MSYSFDPKDDVETQWKKWQEHNPPESFTHVDEKELCEKTIEELTYVSAMDVKEYTLFKSGVKCKINFLQKS